MNLGEGHGLCILSEFGYQSQAFGTLVLVCGLLNATNKHTNMSMSGQNSKSPSCSPSIPNNTEYPDADPDTLPSTKPRKTFPLGLSDLMWNSSSLLPDDASSASALAMEHVPAGRLRTCAQCAQALTTLAMNAPTKSLRSVQTVMVPALLQARNVQHSSLSKKHSESRPKSAVHFQTPESKLVSLSQQTCMPKSQLIVKQTWLTAILLLVTRMPN